MTLVVLFLLMTACLVLGVVIMGVFQQPLGILFVVAAVVIWATMRWIDRLDNL